MADRAGDTNTASDVDAGAKRDVTPKTFKPVARATVNRIRGGWLGSFPKPNENKQVKTKTVTLAPEVVKTTYLPYEAPAGYGWEELKPGQLETSPYPSPATTWAEVTRVVKKQKLIADLGAMQFKKKGDPSIAPVTAQYTGLQDPRKSVRKPHKSVIKPPAPRR